MKRNYKFNKAFGFCAILSAAIIVCGVVGLFVRGINVSTDYAPGLVEEVRIAPAAIEVTYSGSAMASVETDNLSLSVVISGAYAVNGTYTFPFGQYPTIAALAEGLNGVQDVHAVVKNAAQADSYGVFTNSLTTSRLSADIPFKLYVTDPSVTPTIDVVREALADAGVDKLQEKGTDASDRSFQLTIKATADDYSNQALQEKVTRALQEKFGVDNVAVVQTTYNAPASSKSMLISSIILGFLTVLLIWLYATIRFHWDFALGAIIALLHDFLIMFTFISWFQIEFSTTTLAAVLTIFGYSINATVVILDRVRENIKTLKMDKFTDILNRALNDTLTRSIITTVTTMFASISLWIFTSGSIRSFAIVLTIGLVSGCYSSLFISSGFINFMRRNWSSAEPTKVRPSKKQKAPALSVAK